MSMRGRRCKPLFFGLEDYGSATSKAVCNFIFASHCQGACLIFSQLAGAALSQLGGFLLSLEGRCGGEMRAGCGDVRVAERTVVRGSELEQGMRVEGREAREGAFLVCAGVGGPAIEVEGTQSQADPVRVLALSFVTLVNCLDLKKPTYPSLRCSPNCLLFLLGSGGNVALNGPCPAQSRRKKAGLGRRPSGLIFCPYSPPAL